MIDVLEWGFQGNWYERRIYSPFHATRANDIEYFRNRKPILEIDDSANTVTFHENHGFTIKMDVSGYKTVNKLVGEK